MIISINPFNVTPRLQSYFRTHTNEIQTSVERLSSGLRINRAADDSAGLSISTRLQSKIRGINMAVRNNLDGFSLSQTADQALGEMQGVLQKMRELAVQSLNETYNEKDQQTLQIQMDDLKKSLQNIVDQTAFNGRTLFDGTYQAQQLQIGESIEDTLFVSLQNLENTYLGRRTLVESSSGVDTSSRLLDGDTFTLNGISIRESQASDDRVSTIDQAGSAISKAAAMNAHASETGVKAYATATRTDAQTTLNTHLGAQLYGSTGAVQEVELTGSTYMEINGAKIANFTVSSADQDGQLIAAINEQTEYTGVYAEMSENQELVLIAPDGRNIAVNYYGDSDGLNLESLIGLKSGNDTVVDGVANNGYAYGGGIRLESLYTIEADFGIEVNTVVGDLTGDYSHMSDYFFASREESSIQFMSLETQKDRNQTLNTLDVALEQINSQRGFLGGLTSRLESNTQSLQNQYVEISKAYSRIVDADFAEEVSKNVLHQIQLDALSTLLQKSSSFEVQMLRLIEQ